MTAPIAEIVFNRAVDQVYHYEVPSELADQVVAGKRVLAPFGREVRAKHQPDSALSVLLNILWIILPGLELAIMHLVLAAVFAITIIGLPIAAQHIKLIPLALIPFGREMVDTETGRTYP